MPKASSLDPDAAEHGSRMSEIALRKKKNADAQAAFRQRRATYIASLEETVTSLEQVVLQLQDSCREARAEAAQLRQETMRLRHEGREREKMWRALWQGNRGPAAEGPPPVPESALFNDHPPLHSAAPGVCTQSSPSQPQSNGYVEDRIRYTPTHDAPQPFANNGSYAAQSYPAHQYPGANGHPANTQPLGPSQSPKYGYPPYVMPGSGRDAPWPQSMSQSSSSGTDSCQPDSAASTHSPTYVESTAVNQMPYVSRYTLLDDQKVAVGGIENAAYVFDQSPAVSAPSTPTSSASITSAYQFNFTAENSVAAQEQRPEYPYRRQSNGHGAELTLHGGTADISALAGPSRDGGIRYRVGSASGARRDAPDPAMLPMLPGLSPTMTKASPTRERGDPRHRSARGMTESSQDSRSRSPSPPDDPPISGTLAVIKAQAFGTHRRNRARTKKSVGHAKVAIEALEARGVDLGLDAVGRKSNKRARLHSDDEDAQT